MLRPGVDRGQIERERIEPTAFGRRLRCSEIAVPGMIRRARKGNVEADFDDAVIGPEYRLGHCDEPRMGRDVDEAADPLGMHLDIEALRSSGQGAARHLSSFLE